MNAALKLYKLCPAWRYHVARTWNMEPPFKTHWFCAKCPVKQLNGIGKAYRVALKAKEEI